jgi:hypothetical protein
MTLPVAEKIAQRQVAKKVAKKGAHRAVASKKLPASAKKLPDKNITARSALKDATSKTVKPIGKAAKYSFNNPMAPKQKPLKSVVTYRHIMTAEYYAGMTIILTGVNSKDKTHRSQLMQAAAFTLVFTILYFVAAGGRNAAKFCAALGGLIVLALLLSPANKDVFKRLTAGMTPNAMGNGNAEGQGGMGQSTDPNAPGYTNPNAKPGEPGSGKWPNGVPIPGQPQPLPPGDSNALVNRPNLSGINLINLVGPAAELWV